ncbi:MAG: Gmad2 immunoglobulin-like domain-containing protein [Minisyncoccia bacterium]
MNKNYIILGVLVIVIGAAIWGASSRPSTSGTAAEESLSQNVEAAKATDTSGKTTTSTKPATKPVPKPVASTPTASSKMTYKNASTSDIVVTLPTPGTKVSGSFTISGKARGNWYFEANFPFELRGSNNQVLLQLPMQAMGDWMTPEFVPFYTQVTLPLGYKGPATLVLRNDNASGLPEHDKSVSIPLIVE